jgi:hypothetical protein
MTGAAYLGGKQVTAMRFRRGWRTLPAPLLVRPEAPGLQALPKVPRKAPRSRPFFGEMRVEVPER